MQPLSYFLSFILCLAFGGCASPSLLPEEQRMLRAADSMAQQGNNETAINMYEQILEKTEKKGPVLLALAKTQLENKNLQAAKKTYEAAIALDQNPQAKKGLARCYVLAGNPQTAITLYEEIVHIHPDAQIYTGLGVCYSLLGDHSMAQTFFRNALKEDPTNPESINNLALSLGSSGHTKEAILLLKPLASPVYAPEKFKNNLATLYELDGQTHRARNLFLQTVGPTGADMNLKALQQVSVHPHHFNRPAVER